MADMAKYIIFCGVLLIIVGFIFLAIGKIPGVGKLPGDIILKKENLTFYMPMATCLLISVVLSLIFMLISNK